MNKKLAGVVVAVLAIAAAVWFFAIRGKNETTAAKPTPAPTDPWSNAAGSGSAAPPSAPVMGMSQRWTRDADKPGVVAVARELIDLGFDRIARVAVACPGRTVGLVNLLCKTSTANNSDVSGRVGFGAPLAMAA